MPVPPPISSQSCCYAIIFNSKQGPEIARHYPARKHCSLKRNWFWKCQTERLLKKCCIKNCFKPQSYHSVRSVNSKCSDLKDMENMGWKGWVGVRKKAGTLNVEKYFHDCFSTSILVIYGRRTQPNTLHRNAVQKEEEKRVNSISPSSLATLTVYFTHQSCCSPVSLFHHCFFVLCCLI